MIWRDEDEEMTMEIVFKFAVIDIIGFNPKFIKSLSKSIDRNDAMQQHCVGPNPTIQTLLMNASLMIGSVCRWKCNRRVNC